LLVQGLPQTFFCVMHPMTSVQKSPSFQDGMKGIQSQCQSPMNVPLRFTLPPARRLCQSPAS
jgi:hypothetical protein